MNRPRHLLFAPDAFKGTLSARQVCAIWQAAADRHLPEASCTHLPISDGGEGLVEALYTAVGGRLIGAPAVDPLGRSIRAGYLLLEDGTAVIELAAVAGLPLLSVAERSAAHTTTAGLGMLIAHALEEGSRSIVLGLGGSATNDGGAGAAQVLGMRFFSAGPLPGQMTGFALGAVTAIDPAVFAERLSGVTITIACDVDNPLCGPRGAAAVYGPQKGATAEEVRLLDEHLAHFASLVEADTGRTCRTLPGCGAAGGTALPFIACADVTMKPGIDVVLDAVGFDRHLARCDLVLTGEGCTDEQSAMGKAVSGISRRASAHGVPVIVLSGAAKGDYSALYADGVRAVWSACTFPCTAEEALARAQPALEQAADNLFRLLAL